jgi:hypothetical protein
MNKIISTSPLLIASLSHYSAERDKALAELDICLNKSVGTGDSGSVTIKVIALFKQLAEAQNVLELLNGIKSDNEKEIASMITRISGGDGFNAPSFPAVNTEEDTTKK